MSAWDDMPDLDALRNASADIEDFEDVGIDKWAILLLTLDAEGYEVAPKADAEAPLIYDLNGSLIRKGARIRLKGNDRPGEVVSIGPNGTFSVRFDDEPDHLGPIGYGSKTSRYQTDWVMVERG